MYGEELNVTVTNRFELMMVMIWSSAWSLQPES